MGHPPQAGPIAAVVGPTASGKSDLALALAARLDVEIIVADSRQVYRGMDIGTAKPDAASQQAVPHHLLDVADPDEPFTVADWVSRARAAVLEIQRRRHLPLVVGGTGLYVEALVAGHDYAAQAWSPDVRAALTAELEEGGLEPLAARLVAADPDAARAVDLRNPRRVVRALERAVAGPQAAPTASAYPGPAVLIALRRPRETLYRRIDARARWLFEHGGLLDEVRRLRAAGFGSELRPMTGHGYAEATNVLEGRWGMEQAIEVTARRTRQYAKRQLSWFGRDRRVVWLAAGDRPADGPGVVFEAERVIRTELGDRVPWPTT